MDLVLILSGVNFDWSGIKQRYFHAPFARQQCSQCRLRKALCILGYRALLLKFYITPVQSIDIRAILDGYISLFDRMTSSIELRETNQ